MEDPKALAAPLTPSNDGSALIDQVPRPPSQDAKSNMGLKDGEVYTRQETAPHKNEGSDKVVEPGAEVSMARDWHRCSKLVNKYQHNSEDSNSSDKNQPTAKRADLEANAPPTSDHTSDADQKKENQSRDPNLVDWDGPDDPTNPMNWPTWKVKAHIFLVSAVTFIT